MLVGFLPGMEGTGIYLAKVFILNPEFKMLWPAVLRDPRIRPEDSNDEAVGYVPLEYIIKENEVKS